MKPGMFECQHHTCNVLLCDLAVPMVKMHCISKISMLSALAGNVEILVLGADLSQSGTMGDTGDHGWALVLSVGWNAD